MKSVERESLIKSFLLFFLSQSLLVGALFFLNYQKERQTLDEQLFSKMRICSFDLKCKEFGIDFVPKENRELYRLYKESDTLAAYFTIPGSQKNYLKIFLPKKEYEHYLAQLQKQTLFAFLPVLGVVALLSLLFSLYALSPLRNALRLTEEFIKDILHDFNTPLATLRLNIAILQEQSGENKNITRAKNAVQTILNLQANLRSYLHTHVRQKEHFLLQELLEERSELIAAACKDVRVHIEVEECRLFCNKDAFVRIIDNLLSNACKYNKKGGSVTITKEKNRLCIADSGKGIQNPSRIFERFYKEQERGIGIGLHIVKKLSDELGIAIEVESEVGKGTKFFLNLSNIISH